MFETPRFVVRELARSEVPQVQALFDANPGYFQTVNGRPPFADEAAIEFDERPPPELAYGRHWFGGVFERAAAPPAAPQGVIVVVSDLVVEGVWHLTLLLLADRLHGSGAAAELMAALERWVVRSGARWLRLVVVRGNARAERFWARCGFAEACVREGIDTGGRVNDVRILVKPLAGGSLADYLALVPRDRPAPPRR